MIGAKSRPRRGLKSRLGLNPGLGKGLNQIWAKSKARLGLGSRLGSRQGVSVQRLGVRRTLTVNVLA